METFDLCLAWNWRYDGDFVQMLARACQSNSISFFQVTPANITDTLQLLATRRLHFRAFLDRASDEEHTFSPLATWVQRRRQVISINPNAWARRAWDKVTTHHMLHRAGVSVPAALAIPSYQEQSELSSPELGALGERFAIKPAHGGGGKGVVVGATSWEQVLIARQQFPFDSYLVQAHVTPMDISGRPAWFRIIYCAGQLFTSWWHPQTHVYSPVRQEDYQLLKLDHLSNIVSRIAELCGLGLFSTEIACTAPGCFTVVDYVNDPIDLRLQSQAFEGVPDYQVEAIARRLARYVSGRCYPQRAAAQARRRAIFHFIESR